MRVIITSKNFNASDHLKQTIESNLKSLANYFSKDIVANVTLAMESGRQKIKLLSMPNLQFSGRRRDQ